MCTWCVCVRPLSVCECVCACTMCFETIHQTVGLIVNWGLFYLLNTFLQPKNGFKIWCINIVMAHGTRLCDGICSQDVTERTGQMVKSDCRKEKNK